jgi:hypothetical protein
MNRALDGGMAEILAATRDPDAAALIERRVLAFRPAALVAAMQRGGKGLGLLKEEEVTEARPLPDRQAVAFTLRQDGVATERVLGIPELTAMLIAYCIGAGLPLPSRAGKTVQVTQGGVTLDFVMSFAAPPRGARNGTWR